MFLGLMLLVGLGVVLAVVSLFMSKKEESSFKESHFAYQSATERAMMQLKDQIFTLEFDVKKDIRLSIELQKDVKDIKETRLAKIEDFIQGMALSEKINVGNAQTVSTTKLQEATGRIEALEEDNKKLTNQIAFLSTQLDELTEERDVQDRLVFQLREREVRIREQLKRVDKDCQDFKISLNDATKAKLEMKDKLFSLKIMSGDSEKELQRLKAQNKELMDHLSYERNM